MRRITVVLDIFTLRRIRQSVLHLPVVDYRTPGHPGRRRANFGEFVELFGAASARPRSRQEAVRLAVQDAANGRPRVVAGSH